MNDSAQAPAPARNFGRFRLRTIFEVMLILSVCLTIGVYIMRAENRRRAKEALLRAAGPQRFYYELAPNDRGGYTYRQGQPGPAWLSNLIGKQYVGSVLMISGDMSDAELAHVAAFPKLTSLSATQPAGRILSDAGLEHLGGLVRLETLGLHGGEITDEGLEHLRPLVNLQVLWLSENNIRGSGLRHFAMFSKLRTLGLYDNPIQEEGLIHVGAIRTLEQLHLSGTGVTDAGLLHLTGLDRLLELNLSDTGVTGDGLLQLAKLPNLRELTVYGTDLTEDEIAALQAALPQCEVSVIRRPTQLW